MNAAESYKVAGESRVAAKQHERLKGAYKRFQKLLARIDVRQVGGAAEANGGESPRFFHANYPTKNL